VCQGAAAFTALELMFDIASPKRQHLPRHDLESFFYVIVVIAMLFTKPGEKRGPDYWKKEHLSESLGTWWNAKDWTASAMWKIRTMQFCELDWQVTIARHIMDGYFDCWMPHICELRKAIFGGMDVRATGRNEPLNYEFSNSSPIGYDKMISVLEAMVKVGEEEDRKEDHSQPSSPRNGSEQGEWKEYFALESSDGSQTCDRGITEYVFTKVETFKIMNAIERSVVQLPDNIGAVNSDVPADQYPADAYLGNLPSVRNIPKFDNSSIRTSDLPTASRSTLSQSNMPSPSVTSDQTHSTKRMGLAQPGDEPEHKKPRQNQPTSSSSVKPSRQNQPTSSSSVKPSRKDQVSSTSKSASLKKACRTSDKNRQPAQRAGAGTSTVASTRASSSRKSRRKYGDDDEFIPSTAEEERGDAGKAVQYMKSLSLNE
jgi:hypothetical protein